MNPQGHNEKTVATLQTPIGVGAIAVVCLTGPQAPSILGKVFKPARSRTEPAKEGEIVLGRVFDDLGEIDEVLAISLRCGSQTHVELHTHGSSRVVERLLGRLKELGAEIAAEADSPERFQWIQGDELQRDLWETLTRCQTLRAVRFACVATKALREWLGAIPDECDSRESESLGRDCAAMLARFERNRLLIDGVHVALVGPPNAGKSTLANRLFGRQAAVENPEPGTTRDWVEEPTSLGGVPITVVDTAGLRLPMEHIEDEAIRRGQERAKHADQRWFVADLHEPLSPQGRAYLERAATDPQCILILNKADLPTREVAVSIPPGWKERAVRVSARTGAGLDELARLVESLLGLGPINGEVPNLVCQRQAESVRSAVARWRAGKTSVWARLRADLLGAAGIQSQ